MKITLLANVVIDALFAALVIIAAIHFEKPSLLGWWILLPFLGHRYSSENTSEKGGDHDE